ncbi:MAG: trans-2-enoyl-CoA reductase family protein [Puniceicoccales bacterium]|jgi:enoyl-[acyl-carrier protein] reductase/trans-2-enoyl-CoA reductase (NAD+)|nr:trans-2-enoyl-CoA reductase family protein [Puniceicoccales bacterium]
MSTKQVVRPKIRSFICVSAHPEGCAAHVREQADYIRAQKPLRNGPRSVLILGASTGYGLASRIALAYGCRAATLGVFFEKPCENGRPASAGWYNTAAFESNAHRDGIWAKSLNGDAFSEEIKERTISLIKKEMPKIDLVIYSLASPRRVDPATGITHRSVLKPVEKPFSSKTLDTDKHVVEEITISPASEEEVADTIKVMGGEDWLLWMNALDEAGVLAEGCNSVAYSYIGPEVTWPVYKNGTIGRAKKDLERAARAIDALLKIHRGRAFISVNKAVVTQASSAIPVVPLYIALLFKVMKQHNLHEDCIQQVWRLFSTQIYNDNFLDFDEAGRVRLDDWELSKAVQEEVFSLWPSVTTENLNELTDYAGYQNNFLKLFGFGIPEIDYDAEVEIDVPIALA